MRRTLRHSSLERRLIVLLVLALVLFGATAGYVSHEIARHEADEMFDAQLAQTGQNLLAIGQTHGHALSAPAASPAQRTAAEGIVHPYQSELGFQLWSAGSPIPVLRSGDAPETLLDPMPPHGFSDGLWQGRPFRFYRARQGDMEVLVGEGGKARAEIAAEVAERTLIPYAFGLPLLVMVGIVLIRVALQPLRNLAQEVEARSPGFLEPLATEGLPRELLPLVRHLNGLLNRLGTTLENERRFTADAAHELRTPLAALRAQAESALMAEQPEEIRAGLRRVLVGSGRLEHLVGQLLTLARLEGGQHTLRLERIDLGRVAEGVCADIAPATLARGQEISLVAEGLFPVMGQPDLLGALLRNLVDNAVRYTPPGGNVTVALSTDDGRVCLQVSDDGPGVPSAELTRLGDRFHRLQPAQEGAGLGLSIVRRIAELHGASLAFAQGEPEGLVVTLEFARAGAALIPPRSPYFTAAPV